METIINDNRAKNIDVLNIMIDDNRELLIELADMPIELQIKYLPRLQNIIKQTYLLLERAKNNQSS